MKKRGYKLFRWTGAHRKWVSENMHLTDAQMAAAIGVNAYRVQAFRNRHGLKKEHCGYFPKGHTPHNKGKAAPWAKEKCRATQFYKGQRPHTARPVGTIRAESDHGSWRLMICVERGRAKPYARYLWEQEKGAVPLGHVVRIINGQWDDVRIDNLMCITRGESARLNAQKITPENRTQFMRRGWQKRRLRAAKQASQPYQLAA